MENLEQQLRAIFEEHGIDEDVAEAFISNWKSSNPPIEEVNVSIPELETALLGTPPSDWRERCKLQARIMAQKFEQGY